MNITSSSFLTPVYGLCSFCKPPQNLYVEGRKNKKGKREGRAGAGADLKRKEELLTREPLSDVRMTEFSGLRDESAVCSTT